MAITRIGKPAIADVRGVNFRNICQNGDMSIAQRGTSFTSSDSANNDDKLDLVLVQVLEIEIFYNIKWKVKIYST